MTSSTNQANLNEHYIALILTRNCNKTTKFIDISLTFSNTYPELANKFYSLLKKVFKEQKN
jgi:hypothetical protein